jgi:hypothetical protein
MGDINRARSSALLSGSRELHFFRPAWFRRKMNWGKVIASEAQIAAVGLSFLASSLSLGQPSISLISGLTIFVLLANRLLRPPQVHFGPGGIRLKINGRWHASTEGWSEAGWRRGPGSMLHLRLGRQWVAVDLDHYPAGRLMPSMLEQYCPESELPTGQIEIIMARGSGAVEIERSPLEMNGPQLRAGKEVIRLDMPLGEISRMPDGWVRLSQGLSSLTIHPHDPRLAHILAQPVAAYAQARAKLEKPKRFWQRR